MTDTHQPLSIYIHVPFCTHRCAYCDFNTYAGQEAMIPAYVEALTREIDFVGRQLQRQGGPNKVHTVFFGGGTPSLLSPLQFASIFQSLRASFELTSDAEITIEANPGTVAYEALCQLREIGINRISYGVQSANAFELKMLERAHGFLDVIQAVTSTRRAGFENLNLDLIYGLPEQTLASWQSTVQRIMDLHPEHLSAYALTLEHGTPFGRWAQKGLLPLPVPDLAAEMYEWANETLEAHGYLNYEISNWARRKKDEAFDEISSFSLQPSAFACRHNLQYWRGLPYLAFGAGAHGYANGYRYSNVLRIKTYIERLEAEQQPAARPFPLSPAAVNHHKQTVNDDMTEFMMIGLRLTQAGVSFSEFETRFGRKLEVVFGREVQELLKLGLLERIDASGQGSRDIDGILRLTKHGRLLGNQVFMRFI